MKKIYDKAFFLMLQLERNQKNLDLIGELKYFITGDPLDRIKDKLLNSLKEI